MGIKTKRKKDCFLSGIPVSNGLALGKVYLVPRFVSITGKESSISPENIKEEVVRLKQALQILLVVCQCSENFLLKNSNTAAADIFALQRAFLRDPFLIGQIFSVIEKKLCSAETALRLVLDDYAQRFASMDNQRIKERASDIRDLRNMMLDALHNPLILLPKNPRRRNDERPRIAVAFELTPRLVIEQNMIGVKGIIAEKGGRTSHAAILCQALGIPVIIGIKDVMEKIEKNRRVFINGTDGEIIMSPTRKSIFRILYKSLINKTPKQVHFGKNQIRPLLILATINFARESRYAAKFQAEGIGLFRTEMECITLRRFLSEEEQLYRYMEVLENMEGRPVYIRLLDIGGDKKISEFDEGPQTSSNARGAQYLLENPEVLRTQARAIARASVYGCVNVVYPMISGAEQFSDLREKFLSNISLVKSGTLRHGVMFELPAACRQAHDLLSKADFASIGTNDLIEQLFNLNRNSEEAYKAASHPALWKMIDMVMHAAKERGKTVLVCGELVKRPEFLGRYLALGINGISVPLDMIHKIRHEIATRYEKHRMPKSTILKPEKQAITIT